MSETALCLTYTPWQKEVFFENTARFTTIEKGRRVGFTKGIANATIEWLLEGKKVLWVDTITSNLQRYYERYFLPELKALPKELYKFHAQDKKLSIGEGYLDMRSAERPENIEGFGYDIVILNEAGIILKDAYLWDNAIRAMLLDNPKSRAFIGGVPKGKNRFYDLAKRGMSGDKDWKNYQISSFNNPLLKKEQIDEMVAELGGIDSDVVRQEIYGEFLDTTSNVLFNLALIENAFSTQMSNEKASIVWGLDVAREGDDESVLCIRQGYGVTNFYTFRLDSVTALAREIFGIYERSEDKPDAIFIDSVGVGAGVLQTRSFMPTREQRLISHSKRNLGYLVLCQTTNSKNNLALLVSIMTRKSVIYYCQKRISKRSLALALTLQTRLLLLFLIHCQQKSTRSTTMTEAHGERVPKLGRFGKTNRVYF